MRSKKNKVEDINADIIKFCRDSFEKGCDCGEFHRDPCNILDMGIVPAMLLSCFLVHLGHTLNRSLDNLNLAFAVSPKHWASVQFQVHRRPSPPRTAYPWMTLGPFQTQISGLFLKDQPQELSISRIYVSLLGAVFSRTNLTDTSFVCFMSRTGSTAPNGIPKILVDTSMSW